MLYYSANCFEDFRMNSIFWSIFCVVIWCSICKIEIEANTGLIFNAKTEQLDEINEKYDQKVCPLCIVACPGSFDWEITFTKRYAVSKSNALFSQIVSGENEIAADINTNVCETSFKPSMIFDRATETYVVGYEFFYKKDEVKLECRKYDDFMGISETAEIESYERRSGREEQEEHPSSSTEVNLAVTQLDDGKNTIFVLQHGPTLVFHWASILSFKFNPALFQIRINLTSDVINDYHSMEECDNYDLGHEIFTSDKKLYPFSTQVHQSLVKTQLMPMMFLHTKAAKLGTCTQFNTIPVWSSIVEGQLKFIDQYLYTVYRHYGSRINMIFGVSEMQEINGNMIIPKIMYRIVEYMMPLQYTTPILNPDIRNSGKSTTSNFYIVVVIHNDVDVVLDEERLCPEPQISNWEVIWNENLKSGLSYTCSLTSDLIKRLGAFDTQLTRSLSAFDLGSVHLSADWIKGFETEDVISDIENERTNLFGERQ